MRRINIVFAVALGVIVAAPPVPAAGGQPVDPRQMDRAPRVAQPGPVDARIIGTWDVWIPGSVYYLSDGRRVSQHYQPGAAMNRLEIAADSRYRWGERNGRLEEVQPWHHQPGRRYFRIVHASGNEYEFYYGDGDKLVLLFGGVGGHAATGTRLGGGAAPATAAKSPAAGSKVEVKWGNAWYPGRILRADGGRYLVSYDGYGSNWDEWVDATRIRGGAGAAPAPAPAPAPTAPAPAAGNPLGVEWRTAPAPAPVRPAPESGNPLGVEWATAQRPATDAPAVPIAPPVPPAPRDPVSITPPPPAPVPDPAPPVAQPRPNVAASHPVVDRWRYTAATFHDNSGRTDNAPDVGGTLHFKDNGEYEQSLLIGGIANVVRGTWEIAGDRITTRYNWRGQPASDEMRVHLRADGKQLTLVRQGSPTAYYTLDRIE